MIKAVLASNNQKKILELETLLTSGTSNSKIEVLSLREIGYTDDIVEDGFTFEENSLLKASVPASLGYVGIADDSGLAVDFLKGAPGIYSARYAGEHGDDGKNREKLLREMEGVPMEQRGGGFVCAVSVVLPEGCPLTIPEEYRVSSALAEKLGLDPLRAGVIRRECRGVILTEERGDGGFGYDSLFYYPDYKQTFAEIDGGAKNAVSHRGRAMRELHRLFSIMTETER